MTTQFEIEIYSKLLGVNDYLQFARNKLSIDTKLFIVLFKLAQLVKFVLALI